MNVPAWHIVGWPVVELSVEHWKELSKFQLVGQSARHDQSGRRLGNTLWAAEIFGQQVGLAWEWCEVLPNVIVMTDPMSIMSNVTLTAMDGRPNEFERVLHLNNAVYQINWQKGLASVQRPQELRELSSPLAA